MYFIVQHLQVSVSPVSLPAVGSNLALCEFISVCGMLIQHCMLLHVFISHCRCLSETSAQRVLTSRCSG